MKIVVSSLKGGTGKSTLIYALADVLDSDILDLDNQSTLIAIGELGGRHKPIERSQARKKFTIIDTAPYLAANLSELYREAELILIPCRVSAADLLALAPIVTILEKSKSLEKAVIVFNAVRKPHTKSYQNTKKFFSHNYPNIRMAKQELSLLVGFQTIFEHQVSGKAKNQIEALAQELNLCVF